MSRAEILLLVALAFMAGVLSSGQRGEQAMIEEATTRTMHPAAAIVDVPGQAPDAIPDPNALFAPCPLTPRNLPAIRKNLA